MKNEIKPLTIRNDQRRKFGKFLVNLNKVLSVLDS
uniref:Uncharacterized protein n=1 Tax=Tetranychus urticae TaxID=32264 RepID=T1JS58_TETUR